MNLDKLYAILKDTTEQFRKGEVFEGTPALVEQAKAAAASGNPKSLTAGGVLEVYMMPHVDDAEKERGGGVGAGLEMVDLEFVMVGVNKARAEARRAELIGILNSWPAPERLAGGPSYIEVGGIIGDQGAAFQLFALGKVLGLWDLITPTSMGFAGPEARDMAGSGFIMITGYHPKQAAA